MYKIHHNFVSKIGEALMKCWQVSANQAIFPVIAPLVTALAVRGDRFMALAKSGQIQNVCQPNAILTFKEYLLDYASPETRKIGEEAIREHLAEIPKEKVRKLTEERLKKIEEGERDLAF